MADVFDAMTSASPLRCNGEPSCMATGATWRAEQADPANSRATRAPASNDWSESKYILYLTNINCLTGICATMHVRGSLIGKAQSKSVSNLRLITRFDSWATHQFRAPLLARRSTRQKASPVQAVGLPCCAAALNTPCPPFPCYRSPAPSDQLYCLPTDFIVSTHHCRIDSGHMMQTFARESRHCGVDKKMPPRKESRARQIATLKNGL